MHRAIPVTQAQQLCSIHFSSKFCPNESQFSFEVGFVEMPSTLLKQRLCRLPLSQVLGVFSILWNSFSLSLPPPVVRHGWNRHCFGKFFWYLMAMYAPLCHYSEPLSDFLMFLIWTLLWLIGSLNAQMKMLSDNLHLRSHQLLANSGSFWRSVNMTHGDVQVSPQDSRFYRTEHTYIPCCQQPIPCWWPSTTDFRHILASGKQQIPLKQLPYTYIILYFLVSSAMYFLCRQKYSLYLKSVVCLKKAVHIQLRQGLLMLLF